MSRLTEPGNPPKAAPDEPTHWLVKPETIRRLWIVFGVILAGIAAGDFFVDHYEHFGIDGTFGFYAWYRDMRGHGGGGQGAGDLPQAPRRLLRARRRARRARELD